MKKPNVYIIHGILGSAIEYVKMRKTLSKAGFQSHVFSYKSRKTNILDAAEKLYQQILADKPETISFITHSLGGLVLRALFLKIQADEIFPKIHRIVMIAPPNQGTVSGNFMNKYAVFKYILGVNLRDVMNNKDSLARKLPVDLNAEVGIIAGIRGKKSGYNPFIGEDNDGEIRPEETKLGTETDFLTVKANHLSILHKNETILQTLYFLKSGKFEH